MENEIVIHYKATFEELYKASKYILLHSKFVKIILFGVPGFVLLNFLISSTSGKESSYSDYLLPIVILPLLWGLIFYKSLNQIKKKILHNQRNFEDIKITLDKNSFIQEGKTFRVQTFWKDIYQVKETKDWFLLFSNQNSAVPIVKKDLSQEQLDGVTKLFSTLNIKKSLL